MKIKFVEQKTDYDGSELKPLYAYIQHQLPGDSVVAFIGACDVHLDHMVDAEDFVTSSAIKSDEMLHLIVELFGQNLMTAVSLQRLLVSIAQNILKQDLRREGDDLYLDQPTRKLSVSIASVSPVSAMIHLGLNVRNEGTPVATCSLTDFKVDPKTFALELMKQFKSEYESIIEATQKVHPLA